MSKTYLITGSNIGLGYDAARQLALKDETRKVYLACRTESKALKAIDELATVYKIPKEKLSFVPFNASADKATISKIVDTLPKEEKLDGLIFNAGGVGHEATPGKATGPNNVIDMVQINLLGHVHLLNALMDGGFLKKRDSVIIYSGSEGARGVKAFMLAPPKLPDTTEQYKAYIDGSALEGKKLDPMDIYSHVKGMAALYWSAWARRNPDYFVLTVSPGATSGTNITSHTSIPLPMRTMMPVMMGMLALFGQSHSVAVGAKRYVDGVTREGVYKTFESGTFVASAKGSSGRVDDQTKLPNGAKFADTTKQDAMYAAMQAYA